MHARDVVLAATLGLVALLSFLTVWVLVREGLDVIVVLSLLILVLIGVGVFGALTTPPDE